MSLHEEEEEHAIGSFGFGKRRRYERLTSDDHSIKRGIQLRLLDSSPDYQSTASRDFDDILGTQGTPSTAKAARTRTVRQRYFSGWRVGAAVSTTAAITLLVVNSIVTIWVWKNPKYQIEDWIGTLHEGKCQDTKEMSKWLHLAINASSTVMLGCSNYCMQYLSSPNIDELHEAHSKRRYLHIGVPNLRNLWSIAWDRSVLWVLLALSSVPLHLLFNSMIFSNYQANSYTVVTASESFLAGGAWNTSGLIGVNTTGSNTIVTSAETIRDKFNNGTTHVNITASECFHAYGSQYVSGSGDVLLVQDQTIWHSPSSNWTAVWLNSTYFDWETNVSVAQNGTVYRNNKTADALLTTRGELAIRTNKDDMFPFESKPALYPSNGWRCPSRNVTTCKAEEVENTADWKPFGDTVKYCLVETVQEQCKLQFSFPIAIAVIVCNAIKATCMALTLWKHRKPSLVTLGDAIAAFLEKPDLTTKGRCLSNRFDVCREWDWLWRNEDLDLHPHLKLEGYRPERVSWSRAASRSRWFCSYFAYFAAFAFAFTSIGRSVRGIPDVWHSGVGTLNGNNLLSMNTSVMGGVLLANTPQAVLSYLYLTFNALLTCMLVADEWTHYFHNPKPLRVSSPIGDQRSTYYLHVPWKYGVPLTVLSGLLHWLASQSIFMVQVTVTSVMNSVRSVDIDRSISTCGYSPVAIILTTIIGGVIVLGGIAVALQRYPMGMPLASSWSAAISAACHPPENDADASVLPVQWGVVGYDDRGVGHCTFTSKEVTEPVEGKRYE